MTLRIAVLSMKDCYINKNYLCLHLTSYFGSKYNFSSSVPHNYETLVSENLRNIQFSKCIQPFVNQSVDEILSTVNITLSSQESVSVLKALRMHKIFKNVELEIHKNVEKFEILCHIFENRCMYMKPSRLISGLRSLLEIGVPSNSSCVISAEQSIIQNINQFTPFNIIGCLYFHHKFLQTNLQEKVVSLLKCELCNKISEISSSAEIMMLIHFLHIFSEEDQKKIQHRILELIPALNVQEICKVITTLAEESKRNIYILNTLCFHLAQKNDLLNLKDILHVLYAFKKLNFIDMKLVSCLNNKIIAEISSTNQPSQISGLLTVCGHLKWRNSGILNSCNEWIASNLELCRPKEFVSFILTVANLNYKDPEVLKILKAMLPFLTLEKIKSSDVWLDVTWSLAILDIVDKENLQYVLSPNFYKPLISNSGFQVVTNKLKLMNLKAVLKLYYPECIFGCDLFLDPEEIPQNSDIENGRKHVIRVLSNFVPKDKYLCIYQNTDLGVFIDAEFIMNSALKPLPLSDFGILSKTTDCKPLPTGSHRIALLILFYKDFTLNYEAPTGHIVLAEKLLSAHGYTVVTISFQEFIRKNTEVQKAKYLLNKICDAIKAKL